LKAVADHGVFLGDTVSANASDSADTFAQLATLGVNVPEILQQLEVEGVQKFTSSWIELLAVVDAALKESPQ
jgi:transaldolase